MRGLRFKLVLASAVLVAACSQQPAHPTSPDRTAAVVDTGGALTASGAARVSPAAKTPLSATVQFGQPNVGSDYPPEPPHDSSAHAKDNLVPRTVVIDSGGTVTFSTFGVHQIAIYSPGTEPGDIDTSITTAPPPFCPPIPLIADPDNLVATYTHACNSGPVNLSHTFTAPGKYLVICSFTPHFEVGMYGWVIVR